MLLDIIWRLFEFESVLIFFCLFDGKSEILGGLCFMIGYEWEEFVLIWVGCVICIWLLDFCGCEDIYCDCGEVGFWVWFVMFL